MCEGGPPRLLSLEGRLQPLRAVDRYYARLRAAQLLRVLPLLVAGVPARDVDDARRARRRLEVVRPAVVEDLDVWQFAHAKPLGERHPLGILPADLEPRELNPDQLMVLVQLLCRQRVVGQQVRALNALLIVEEHEEQRILGQGRCERGARKW